MKRQFLGWAVIFTATLLLSACASHEAQVSNDIKMSGADATMAQTENQELALARVDDTFTYLPPPESHYNKLAGADAAIKPSGNQELAFASVDDTFTYLPPTTDHQRSQPDQRDFDQIWGEKAVFASSSLAEERELQLEQKEIDLEWSQDSTALTQARLDERERLLDQREIDLEFREDSAAVASLFLDERETELAQRENLGAGATQLAGIDSLPTNAEPGRCYAQITVPGDFLTVTDKVLIKPASTKVEIIPARYETVSKEIMVEKGSVQLKTIPAEFRTVKERVMVEPASKYLVHVPAQFEVTLEQEMVAPATKTWKQGSGPIQRVDAATGEIMCLVETPAKFQTVSKRVLKTPATTREVENPPVFATVERRELVTPAKTVLVDIPAKYKTVQVTKMVSPEYQRTTPVPARYQTISKRIKVTDDHMEWQEVLCETNMTENKVSDIQRALAEAGFNPGPIDGIIGEQTMAAVNDFQKAKNLTVSKYLTLDTLVALGPGL